MSIEKYKELYDLSVNVLKEEQDRFNRIDEKASKYFSVFTFLLGTYGFFGKWIIENIIPPDTYLDKLLILLYIIIILLLFGAVFNIFYVLRIQKIKKIPINNEVIKFFDDNELIDIYYALTKGNRDAFSENVTVTKFKTKKLNSGYKLIVLNFIMLLLFSLIYGINSEMPPKVRHFL